MSFSLKAYRNYEWVPLAREVFADYRAARGRAAALLRAGTAEMIAVCAPDEGEGKGRVAACLTACESRGARATEWPGVWEWGPPAADAAPVSREVPAA
jgi:hypothetical protein